MVPVCLFLVFNALPLDITHTVWSATPTCFYISLLSVIQFSIFMR